MIPASLTLAFMLVLAPSVIFSVGLLQAGPAALAAALGIASALPIVRRTDWRGRADWPILAMAVAIAAALTLLSGIGHFFWQTDDWVVRDALLFDLVRNPWPVPYATPAGLGLLRAPLGMYLLPALAGKAGGLGVAQAALAAQNALLIGLCVYLFARALPAGRPRHVMLALFVAFSGMDVIGWIRQRLGGMEPLGLPHIEPWPGYFHYDSNVTEILWTPHHAISGWALVAGYLVWRQGRISALALGPLFAASVFWSPLAAAGALPFYVFAFFCDAAVRKLRLPDFAISLTAALAALPALFYLTRGAGDVEKGLQEMNNPDVLRAYLAMMALEVVPYFALAWEGRDKEDRRSRNELLLIVGLLFAIPFYKLGFANDFAMRVSIPALTLLCVRSVPALVAIGREPIARRAIIASTVALGAVTPAIEIWRNVTAPAIPASPCNVVESLNDGPYAGSPLDYYIASSASFEAASWLFKPPQAAPLTRKIVACWPGRAYVYDKNMKKK